MAKFYLIPLLLNQFVSGHGLTWYTCSDKGDSFCEKGDMCCPASKTGETTVNLCGEAAESTVPI